jgi:outer membrane lipoprotein LolB
MQSNHRFMRASVASGWLVCVLFFTGCASLPFPSGTVSPQRDDAQAAFSLEARFSLRHEDKSYSGRLSWQHAGVNNELLLTSPFGQGLAEITTSANGARLTTSDGKTYSAADAETLTQQVLGYLLPLAQLTEWVRGQVLDADVISERDVHGRPLRLRHKDWSIDYGYGSDDPQALPDRIFAERAGGLELRLRIDEWTNSWVGKRKP